MAHHLAELIKLAEASEGEARCETEDRAVELTLKLWRHRRALPDPADPLAGYRDAIKALGGMLPSSDPWRRYRGTHSDDDVLHEMFGAMAQMVMAGLALTREAEIRALEEAESKALTEEEKFLHNVLERWQLLLGNPAPEPIEIERFYIQLLKHDGEAPEEPVAPPEEPELDPATQNRENILKNLETFQARLAVLIEQWRQRMGRADAKDDEDEDEFG